MGHEILLNKNFFKNKAVILIIWPVKQQSLIFSNSWGKHISWLIMARKRISAFLKGHALFY